MDRVSVQRRVPAAADDALDRFWREDGLAAFWDPIEHVQCLFDDGLLQELTMAVEREGQLERIRIVRFREQHAIVFFNPVPPPMMGVHHGTWRFAPLADGGCLVEAYREYRLLRKPDESDHDHARRRVKFARGLRRRLALLLDAFADHKSVEQVKS
jgi:hypothetical protein